MRLDTSTIVPYKWWLVDQVISMLVMVSWLISDSWSVILGIWFIRRHDAQWRNGKVCGNPQWTHTSRQQQSQSSAIPKPRNTNMAIHEVGSKSLPFVNRHSWWVAALSCVGHSTYKFFNMLSGLMIHHGKPMNSTAASVKLPPPWKTWADQQSISTIHSSSTQVLFRTHG